MMNNILLNLMSIFITLSCCDVNNSKSKHIIQEYTCQDGIDNSLSNAKKGLYVVYFFGHTNYSEKDKAFEVFYAEYIKRTYNIEFVSVGDVVTDYNECFSSKTDDLMTLKHGKEILLQARKEALLLYK